MYVVLDTNIWLRELALQTALGSAVRFFLRKRGYKVAVPEVIRLEVEKNFRRQLREWRDAIAEDHRKLLAMFGKLREVVLPSDEEIEARVTSVFDASGLDIVAVPFSLESARASLLKTIDGVAPSSPKDQQFKDGVIWADCMQLLDQDDVTLVTNDRAFCRERDRPERGPAENLDAEARSHPHRMVLLNDLAQLLSNIREKVQIDQTAVADAMMTASAQSVREFLGRHGYVLGERKKVEIQLFHTEDPTRLAGTAVAMYECPGIDGRPDVLPAVLTQNAEFEYDCATSAVVSIRQRSETVEWSGSDGERHSNRIVYASAHAVLGHGSVSHVVRAPLRDAP